MLERVGAIIGIAAFAPRAFVQAQARSQGLAGLGNALVSLTTTEAETLRAVIARLIPEEFTVRLQLRPGGNQQLRPIFERHAFL
ncbi:MAG: hypothetical protein DMG18_03660 [Acidobacteria bacterium]|nr:MAG: hypothetical protein DMG18_03660 [Acidobacteriota bacterium]